MLTEMQLEQDTLRYRGSGDISAENRIHGFRPAFRDNETGIIYPSQFADGSPAPLHTLEGLPEEVVHAWTVRRGVSTATPALVAGFVLHGRFYTRDEAAAMVSEQPALADAECGE